MKYKIPRIFDQLRVLQRIINLSAFAADADHLSKLIINTILFDHAIENSFDCLTFM